jgi:hypothetical protein
MTAFTRLAFLITLSSLAAGTARSAYEWPTARSSLFMVFPQADPSIPSRAFSLMACRYELAAHSWCSRGRAPLVH